ncbi:MAG TPA: energy transducer TonB [Gammaproteobacteria bacterium]|nr:energy transducer TonB [Gammaproteobacteria bacterium]
MAQPGTPAGADQTAADDQVLVPVGRLPDTVSSSVSSSAFPPLPKIPPAPAHAGGGEAPRAEAAAADAIRRAAAAVSPGAGGSAASTSAAPGADALSSSNAPPKFDSPIEGLIELNRLTAEKQYQRAVPVGQQLVHLAEQEYGESSLEAADAYVTLGRVQLGAGLHDAAEQSYLHGIDLIRRVDGNFSERVIDPLVGLGDDYHAAGKYLNAVTAYGEARTISRRVYGLLNESQIPILERITDSFMALDKYRDADEQQLEILRLTERNYPAGSPKSLDGIYRYARWLQKYYRYDDARAEYDRALQVIRSKHGKTSPLLVEPMREEGDSYRLQGIGDNRGIAELRSALEIASQQPSPDPLATAELLRDIGDWQVAFAAGPPDLSYYRKAWQELGSVKNGAELRKQWFQRLEYVFEEPPNQEGLSNDPSAAKGYVLITFDLDSNGQTHNVEVLKSSPPGLKDEAFTRAVSRSRYRPFMLDGEFVSQQQVQLRFNYRYKQSDGDEKA